MAAGSLPLLLLALGSSTMGSAALARPRLTQGITTAAIRGTVGTTDGSDPAGARVSVRNLSTGFVVEAEVRYGRFLVQGLEVGGPYQVLILSIGTRPARREIGWLSLGAPYELHVVLESTPVMLDTLVAFASSAIESNWHGGTATTIPDSLVHRLPSLNRNRYDLARLVPQISTKVGLGSGGISGGGVNFRLNQFLTNGVPERSLSGSQPPEFAGAKSLPFEAVSEYQVLLAPFDVQYGDFAGAAINTVTRSGTNRMQGSGFTQFRNDALARSDSLGTRYQRALFGLSLSGPVVRDRLHFLLASEFQRLTAPMQGPFLGQSSGAVPAAPVREADLARLDGIMRAKGLVAGSGGAVTNRNPLRNVFGRMDAGFPSMNSRAVLWVNDVAGENLVFARGVRDTVFALSSQANTSRVGIRTAALQLHTALNRAGGGHHELFLSYRTSHFGSRPEVRQPIVTVAVPRAGDPGIVTVITGTPSQAQGGDLRTRQLTLRDRLTLPLGGSHLVQLGLETDVFRLDPSGPAGTFGTWSFQSLDSLESGLAERYQLVRDFGAGSSLLRGVQYAAYAGDRWQLGNRLSLTLGLRVDGLEIVGRPPYDPLVDSILGRRTDEFPGSRRHFSPRIGFTWSLDREGSHRLRGGLGLFTGRPPLAWLQMPFLGYGSGTGLLRCGTGSGTQGPPPEFTPDPDHPPLLCAGGGGDTPPGDVELADPELSMARTLRGVLAWDGTFRGDLRATVEVLITRNRSDFLFVNRNLAGPQSVDRRGRVFYGVVGPTGRSSPALLAPALPRDGVIELRNVGANHSVLVSGRLERRFTRGFSAQAGYTWSRVRDVQTPLRVNNRGVLNWASRVVSGRHDDLATAASLNEIPHRIVLAGTWRAPWKRWTTELSLLYVGESGSPFSYVAFGFGGLGDLNADGSNANDPIYVPRDASDPEEIRFSGISTEAGADNSPAAQAGRISAQQTALEDFISQSPCLRHHRGAILPRNSCREPWSHTSVVSVRQQLPVIGPGLEAQLDAFNVLNLISRSWGTRRVAAPALLEHVGQDAGADQTGEPVFRFTTTTVPWTVIPSESLFQFQLGVSYRF